MSGTVDGTPPARVGLVVHSGRSHSLEAASRVVRALEGHGVAVVAADEGEAPHDVGVEVRDGDFARDLDLVLSLGGDGTFLRAAHRARDAGVPVLGVNLGRLGFLAEVDPEHLHDALERVVAGRWTVEDRATIEVVGVADDGTEIGRGWALNEVSIEKSARQHMLFMDVSVGDHRYTTFGADALIVSTTTGSTAYALSAGGPIVSPHLDATLVVPVAPHTLYDRTLVAHPSETIRVVLVDDQSPAVVSCDGRTPMLVPEKGTITCTGAGVPVRVARIDPLPFPTLLRRKFNLS